MVKRLKKEGKLPFDNNYTIKFDEEKIYQTTTQSFLFRTGRMRKPGFPRPQSFQR